jgi:hypothetical protein
MRRYVSLLLLALLTSLAQAQSTSLRQSRIFTGDIAELMITYESELPSMYSVDTTALEPDFEVLDTSSRVSRLQRDNRSLHHMEWRALLLPRRSGLLSIPALRYGERQSEPLWLSVDPVPAELQALQDVFVEIEAIPQNPYPGQQTRIVTRLYYNLPLQDAVLREPESAQGMAYRSTRDARYEVIRDGETYSVLERSILLAPREAGEWQIQPASFRGSVAAPPPGEPYGLTGATRYLYRAGNPLKLQVRELPAGMDAVHWLPARQLEMKLQWEQRHEPLTAGASLGLSIDLQATGLAGESLPADLLSRESGQYRIYADQAKRSTRVEGPPGDEVLMGRLQQRYAIVFEQAGEITLPALALAWWDTGQDRARVARVESTTLTISAPAVSVDPQRGVAAAATGAQPLRWLALALAGLVVFGLAWIARRQDNGVLAWLERARRGRYSRLRVERACAANDAVAARRGLIDWGRAYWQDQRINSLRQIAARSGLQSWVDELARLDAAVFAAERSAWQGQGLRRLLQQQRRSDAARKRKRLQVLPGPYPRQDVSLRATTSPWPV